MYCFVTRQLISSLEAIVRSVRSSALRRLSMRRLNETIQLRGFLTSPWGEVAVSAAGEGPISTTQPFVNSQIDACHPLPEPHVSGEREYSIALGGAFPKSGTPNLQSLVCLANALDLCNWFMKRPWPYGLVILIAFVTVCPGQTVETPKQKTEPKRANAQSVEKKISVEKDAGAIVVKYGNELFTRYDFSSYAKPILYPVIGPKQIPMTRNWPMKATQGEANDHPHHKSMWLGHELNGLDFWGETTGSVKHDSVVEINSENGSFSVKNDWVSKKDGTIICTEISAFRFGAVAEKKWIDATHTFYASHGDIHFEDTKEGFFAIRTHPDLRLSPDEKRGVEKVFGQAFNSQGTTGKAIWGQKAKWVCYWGPVDEQVVGIAIFDHASNLRHPTTWHAREYGLVTANPFGLHHFQKKEKGAGTHTVKKGDQITFRYRVVFQLGQQTAEELNRQFDEYVGNW